MNAVDRDDLRLRAEPEDDERMGMWVQRRHVLELLDVYDQARQLVMCAPDIRAAWGLSEAEFDAAETIWRRLREQTGC